MFQRVEYLWTSWTSLVKVLEVSKKSLVEKFGKPDYYLDNEFNWCFSSNENHNARYNVYTNDWFRTIKLWHNWLWHKTSDFEKWLFNMLK